MSFITPVTIGTVSAEHPDGHIWHMPAAHVEMQVESHAYGTTYTITATSNQFQIKEREEEMNPNNTKTVEPVKSKLIEDPGTLGMVELAKEDDGRVNVNRAYHSEGYPTIYLKDEEGDEAEASFTVAEAAKISAALIANREDGEQVKVSRVEPKPGAENGSIFVGEGSSQAVVYALSSDGQAERALNFAVANLIAYNDWVDGAEAREKAEAEKVEAAKVAEELARAEELAIEADALIIARTRNPYMADYADHRVKGNISHAYGCYAEAARIIRKKYGITASA